MVKPGNIMNDLNTDKLLERANSLKTAIEGLDGLNSDGSCSKELVSNLTTLQDTYKLLLLKDLEFSLDKNIDHGLWNVIFKNRITAMQQRAKDKKNLVRGEAQLALTTFLDSASGFYSSLLHQLCQIHKVDIPGRVKSYRLSPLRDMSSKDKVIIEDSCISKAKIKSGQYMCQHCLVHLGDIARYRNQHGQAESYYHHAAQLLPSSGHPYNQLAILAAVNGDVLKTAFFYCRSIAVKGPFNGSETNLRRQLSKIMSGDDPKHSKISTSELLKFFLKLHACIYLKKKDNELPGMVERLSNFIRAHLRTGSLSHQQIIHMAFINLFSLQHLAPYGVRSDGLPAETPPTSNENSIEKTTAVSNSTTDTERASSPSNNYKFWNAILAFSLQNLGELLACIPIHSDDMSELEHPALPAVKLLLEWLTFNSSVLKRKDITLYSRVWPRLAKVLNALGNQDKANDMNACPLPEDIEVRGFIGLFSSLQKLNFKTTVDDRKSYVSMTDKQHACRCYRLFQLGMEIVKHNSQILQSKEENNSTVFTSSVLPLPQHALNYNGLDEENDRYQQRNLLNNNNNTKNSSTLYGHDLALDGLDESSSPPLSDYPRYPYSNLESTPRGARHRNGQLKSKTPLTDGSSGGSDGDSISDMLTPAGAISGGGSGVVSLKKNRNPRMQNVAVQMKPDHKLKAIKEEDMVSGGKLLQDNNNPYGEGGGSESGEASNAESLSQSDILSSASPSNLHSGTTNRAGNRVTFAPIQHQQFSPTPYPLEQSPSPNSLTDSFTADNSSVSGMYLPDVGSPQKQQPIMQQTFRPTPQQPINQRLFLPSSYHTQPPPELSAVFSTGRHSNNDPFAINNQTNPYQTFSTQQPPNKQAPPARFPLIPPYSTNSVDYPPRFLPPAVAAPTPARMFSPENIHLRYTAQHHLRAAELQQQQQPQQLNNLINQQQPRMPQADYNMFFPPTGHTPNDITSALKKTAEIKKLYGMQPWLHIPTNVPPPPLPNSNQAAELSYIMRSRENIINMSANGGGVADKSATNRPQTPQQNVYHNQQSPVSAGVVNHSPSPYRSTAEPSPQFSMGMMLDRPKDSSSAGSLPNGNSANSPGQLQPKEIVLRESDIAQSINMRNMQMPTTQNFPRRDSVPGIHPTDFSISNATKNSDIYVDSIAARSMMDHSIERLPSNVAGSDSKLMTEHSNTFVQVKTEDSYKLFPDTNNVWGINTRGNNEGEGFGPSSVGTIGSERAAAAQQQHYSPWSALGGTTPNNKNHSSGHAIQSVLGKAPSGIIDGSHSRNSNYTSQSLWSSPMTPSAPSALEQLIRQQKQQEGGGNNMGSASKTDPPP